MRIGRRRQEQTRGLAGSPGAFADLYDQTIQPFYRFVSHRTGGNRALTEDVVQEAFLRAVSHWADRPPDHPLAWLKTVARNILASHYRRFAPSSLEAAEHDPPQDDLREASPERVALVQWGLTRLRPDQAELLEEFHFEGKPVRDLASAHGLSERAVEGRLRRARLALRRILGPRLNEGGKTLS